MKILAGSLTETVYLPHDSPASESQPLREKSARTFGVNEVTYISDQIGLHRVANPSPNNIAVSLHRESSPSVELNGVTNLAQYTRPPMPLITGITSTTHKLGSLLSSHRPRHTYQRVNDGVGLLVSSFGAGPDSCFDLFYYVALLYVVRMASSQFARIDTLPRPWLQH